MPKVTTQLCRRAVNLSSRRTTSQVNFRTVDQSRSAFPKTRDSFVDNTRRYSRCTSYTKQSHKLEYAHHHRVVENDQDGSSLQVQQPAAAAPEGALSIVFTDIVKSTAMWEKKPEAMAEAMRTHDDIIRSLAQVHEGYEVKQNGDGFMIAFQTALSALQFCLAVQQRLLDQEWPEELLQLKPAKEVCDNADDGKALFRGLRLRMSAHWGEPVCSWNEVIERMDYLGPPVNRAARFIQVAEGGQIVVSDEFLQEIRKVKKENTGHGNIEANEVKEAIIDLDSLTDSDAHKIIGDQRFEVRLLGRHQFKGLDELQKLYFIIPRSLHGRLEFWPKHKYIPGSKGNIIGSQE